MKISDRGRPSESQFSMTSDRSRIMGDSLTRARLGAEALSARASGPFFFGRPRLREVFGGLAALWEEVDEEEGAPDFMVTRILSAALRARSCWALSRPPSASSS